MGVRRRHARLPGSATRRVRGWFRSLAAVQVRDRAAVRAALATRRVRRGSRPRVGLATMIVRVVRTSPVGGVARSVRVGVGRIPACALAVLPGLAPRTTWQPTGRIGILGVAALDVGIHASRAVRRAAAFVSECRTRRAGEHSTRAGKRHRDDSGTQEAADRVASREELAWGLAESISRHGALLRGWAERGRLRSGRPTHRPLQRCLDRNERRFWVAARGIIATGNQAPCDRCHDVRMVSTTILSHVRMAVHRAQSPVCSGS